MSLVAQDQIAPHIVTVASKGLVHLANKTLDELRILRLEELNESSSDALVRCLQSARYLEVLCVDSSELCLSKVFESVYPYQRYPTSLTELSVRRSPHANCLKLIVKLRALKRLDLSGNGLTELPDSVPKLQRLVLANNKLSTLPTSLNADVLVLSGNPLSHLTVQTEQLYVANCAISACPQIFRFVTVLDVSKNLIVDVSAMARALEDEACIVRHLDVSDNRFGVQGSASIGTALRRNRSLLTLKLNGNRAASEKMADGVAANDGLVYLSVQRCDIDDAGFDALADAAMRNVHLEEFDMSHNRINPMSLNEFQAKFKSRSKPPVRQRLDMLVQQNRHSAGSRVEAVRPVLHLQSNERDQIERQHQKHVITVAYGRQHNVLGTIECTSTTTLQEARAKIKESGMLQPESTKYQFSKLSVEEEKQGGGVAKKNAVIPFNEEDIRLLLVELGSHICLRPPNWIDL